jgi:hypothetical protein
MRLWWKSAIWLCCGAAIVLLLPAVVLASNCSNLTDCWGMARGAAAAAAGAGAAAAASSDGADGDGGGGGETSSGGAEGD